MQQVMKLFCNPLSPLPALQFCDTLDSLIKLSQSRHRYLFKYKLLAGKLSLRSDSSSTLIVHRNFQVIFADENFCHSAVRIIKETN